MAQSTNDTIPTAIRLGCLWRLDELLSALDDLVNALDAKADEFDDIVKSGRTHLQDAVPVRMGQEFGAYAMAIRRDAERIRRAAEGLRRLGIGGTAVGSGLNAHPQYHSRMVRKLSQLTGLELHESDNLFESMQSMSDAADFSGFSAHPGVDPDPYRQRFPPALVRAIHRIERNPFARPCNRARRSCRARSIRSWPRC